MIEQFKERFEKLHACAPIESAGGMWYPKEEVDSLVKDMMAMLSRFRDTNTFHVIVTRCPSCNELLVVRAEDPSEFI